MTQLEKLDVPLSLTFTQGEWDVIRGAICGVWVERKQKPGYSKEHIDFLESIMRRIDHAKGRL